MILLEISPKTIRLHIIYFNFLFYHTACENTCVTLSSWFINLGNATVSMTKVVLQPLASQAAFVTGQGMKNFRSVCHHSLSGVKSWWWRQGWQYYISHRNCDIAIGWWLMRKGYRTYFYLLYGKIKKKTYMICYRIDCW